MRKAIFAAVIAAVPAVAIAGPAEDTVAARQGYYKLLGANIGVFAAMAKGQRDYDATAAQAAADNIVTLTTYNNSHLWVPGTSSEDVEGSRALPKIWADFPGVKAKGMDFVAAAMEMQTVAGQGKGEMAAALGKLGGACNACHDSYRAK